MRLFAGVSSTLATANPQTLNLKLMISPSFTMYTFPSSRDRPACLTAGILPCSTKSAKATTSDYGLYKCSKCGSMVMGFMKDEHVRELHEIKDVVWGKMGGGS